MEFIVLAGLAGALGATCWLAKTAATALGTRTRAKVAELAYRHALAQRAQRAQHSRHQQLVQRRAQLQRLNGKARALQLALLRVEGAPDFRRAASFAAQARDVPAAFRQRQFRRFRPVLLRHFVTQLRAGTEATVLLQSLRELLAGLAIPAYEADYVANEAQAAVTQQTVPEARPSYAQRLTELERDHGQRLEALRSLHTLDLETREQLLEAEETRFRQALQELGGEAPRPSP